MGIDFTLSPKETKVKLEARQFARNILAPIVREADREPDPLRAFQLTKPAYREAHRAGVAFCMVPKRYGGAGLTSVELVIASEEVCAVDPGFGCTILVNGLGTMPVFWYGSEEQRERFLRAATSDPTGEFLAGYAISEPPGLPGGTANFDSPLASPAGLGVIAERRRGDYVLNGQKCWPCNVGGWDGGGADVSLVVVRTDPAKGGTEGLSAIVVERGTRGVRYRMIDKVGHRLSPNCEMILENARVPARNLIEGSAGNGDLLVNRNFAWSGPVAGIAAVGVARAAYEDALEFCKTSTAGGPRPIIQHQNAGYVLGDVAARIEAARYFCWRAAHYIDRHDYHGELVGAMCKTFCTELMFDSVYKCLQVVGVNSADRRRRFEKHLREAAIFPLYDGGNMGMQRRRVHGIIASPDFNPRALMDDEAIEFTKEMEGIDTLDWDRPPMLLKR